jgi:uncharacterized protein (DUF885 family)
MTESPTAQQLAHNDQVLADINTRIDGLIAIHREVLADGDLHPQVALAGFASHIEEHADATALAQILAVAIDRLTRAAEPS